MITKCEIEMLLGEGAKCEKLVASDGETSHTSYVVTDATGRQFYGATDYEAAFKASCVAYGVPDDLSDETKQVIRALSHEIQRLKVGGRPEFFSMTPDEVDSHFDSNAAKQDCEDCIEHHRDGGWHEDMNWVRWGVFAPVEVAAQVRTRPACHCSSWDYFCDYELRHVVGWSQDEHIPDRVLCEDCRAEGE